MSLTHQTSRTSSSDSSPVADSSTDAAVNQARGNGFAQDTAAFAGGSHTVVAGDTLWGLAARYYGNGRHWHRIRDANPGKVYSGGHLIYVDTELTIPASPRAQTDEGQAQGGGEAGGNNEALECVDYSTLDVDGLAELMTEVATGTRPLDPINRDGLIAHLNTLSNEDFAELQGLLDASGNLFGFLQATMSGTVTSEVDGAVIDTEIPVMCWRLWNADDRIDADVKRANEIYNHEGIGVIAASKRTITKADAERAAGTTLPDDYSADVTTTGNGSEHTFSDDDFANLIESFIPTSVIGGLWVKDFTRASLFGLAGAEYWFADNVPRVAAISSATARDDTFAHEIGHILLDSGHRDTDSAGTNDPESLMHRGDGRNTTDHSDQRLTDDEVATIKASAFSWAINQCGT